MLDLFKVSARTDAQTVASIIVEPGKRQCAVTVTVAGRIVALGDESRLGAVRSFSNADWSNPDKWEAIAAQLARQHSPFWRGETAN